MSSTPSRLPTTTMSRQNTPPFSNQIPVDPPDYVFPKNRLKSLMEFPDRTPVVLVACGSFSPITYLHLRMFEMAMDYFADQSTFELIGGYFSPVADGYAKSGLASWFHRVRMCDFAVIGSNWLMVDPWEASQSFYLRTAPVLDHFHECLNLGNEGGIALPDGSRKKIRIMLLAGGDLIQSFALPNVWAEKDLNHIIGYYGCVIIERTGTDVAEVLLSNDPLHKQRKSVFVVKQYIHNDISSTKIRLFVKRGLSIKYLVPDEVLHYIHDHKLYANPPANVEPQDE
ncbi:nicotinate-nucleotide adenylyltransferase [Synchytrium microbalum]|uniref:Nicotinamide-nucleotide adenylyltransferase n=1 Tax=Synchytrium microbalum TaxID=1806994 RepID=A0A507CFW2_9FUNG|nr:nicotinate-nucleotide adenylyltransferase [Synchytrium microbalum]TPX38069.1 nicotinate-nucleotide adenylyltransferase [Synchytrium microbalum]